MEFMVTFVVFIVAFMLAIRVYVGGLVMICYVEVVVVVYTFLGTQAMVLFPFDNAKCSSLPWASPLKVNMNLALSVILHRSFSKH